MDKPVTPEQLADEIQKILKDYEGELDEKIGEAMDKVATKGVQLLKEKSPVAENSPYKGTYRKGWTKSVENHRNLTHEAVIYNRHPGMPHLLEHGHLARNGRRVPGVEHIKPVEETLEKEFNVEDILP